MTHESLAQVTNLQISFFKITRLISNSMWQITFVFRIFLISSLCSLYRNRNRITHSPRGELALLKRTKSPGGRRMGLDRLSFIQPSSINFRRLPVRGGDDTVIRHRTAHVWTQRGLKSNEDTFLM